MKKGKGNCECNNLLVVLMVLCVLLSLTTLGIVVYDKYVKVCDDTTASCWNK